jgi:hypothetical protein
LMNPMGSRVAPIHTMDVRRTPEHVVATHCSNKITYLVASENQIRA